MIDLIADVLIAGLVAVAMMCLPLYLIGRSRQDEYRKRGRRTGEW